MEMLNFNITIPPLGAGFAPVWGGKAYIKETGTFDNTAVQESQGNRTKRKAGCRNSVF